jgi:hypothetical protein
MSNGELTLLSDRLAASHEVNRQLRNELASMKNWVELLRQELRWARSDQLAMVNHLHAAAEHLRMKAAAAQQVYDLPKKNSADYECLLEVAMCNKSVLQQHMDEG